MVVKKNWEFHDSSVENGKRRKSETCKGLLSFSLKKCWKFPLFYQRSLISNGWEAPTADARGPTHALEAQITQLWSLCLAPHAGTVTRLIPLLLTALNAGLAPCTTPPSNIFGENSIDMFFRNSKYAKMNGLARIF